MVLLGLTRLAAFALLAFVVLLMSVRVTQAFPRVRTTQFLCARGKQVLLWRFA